VLDSKDEHNPDSIEGLCNVTRKFLGSGEGYMYIGSD
jgi:hypothetical protein